MVELASPTDGCVNLIAKMREYQENGVRLGWLILPAQRQVYRFAGQGPEERLNEPMTMTDDEVPPGFSLGLASLWVPGF